MVRPCCLNRPSCRATKKPAESAAGATATLSVVFSSPIGLVLPALAASPPQPESAIRAIATGGARMRVRTLNKVFLLMCGLQAGARIVKQEELLPLPFKGNSVISRIKLPVSIPVAGSAAAGNREPVLSRGVEGP